ncbi:GTPase HflX, partial [Butyricicoccus sp. 1XD8-22]
MKEIEVLIEKGILVGVNLQNESNFQYSMEELADLAEALDVQVVGTITQNLER